MIYCVNIAGTINEETCEITHVGISNNKAATLKKNMLLRLLFYYAPKQCQNFTL